MPDEATPLYCYEELIARFAPGTRPPAKSLLQILPLALLHRPVRWIAHGRGVLFTWPQEAALTAVAATPCRYSTKSSYSRESISVSLSPSIW